MVAITLTPKIKNLDKLLAHCHRRRYTAKSTIIYAGDRCETLFFIVKGSVTILIEDDDGRAEADRRRIRTVPTLALIHGERVPFRLVGRMITPENVRHLLAQFARPDAAP